MKGDSLIRRSRVRDTAWGIRDGEGARPSRGTLVAVIVIAVVLACGEREVSGARDGSFRSQLSGWLHHVAGMRPA
ncbi:hypothetical protein [Paraburkholderia ferrariae]|jgi:hypothetical protein|uniref:hypothetical protein n=1 Tax=Paraburkholderia ferrariae TaxID=386056 RepID=UPI0012EB5148|nr:hypothetical protein [Paraburkholderia ferrariae]